MSDTTTPIDTTEDSGSVDLMMKAQEDAKQHLAVIEEFCTLENAPTDAPAWEQRMFRAAAPVPKKPKRNAAPGDGPQFPIVVVDHICEQLGSQVTQGARFEERYRAVQRTMSDNLFRRPITTVVLDTNPAQVGEPDTYEFRSGTDDDRELTVFFTGIPETSALYDDMKSAYQAIIAYPEVNMAVRLPKVLNNGLTVPGDYLRWEQYKDIEEHEMDQLVAAGQLYRTWQPSKSTPNVIAVVRTYATRDAAVEDAKRLRQALVDFSRCSPDWIEMQDAARKADPANFDRDAPFTVIDGVTGEIRSIFGGAAGRRVPTVAEQVARTSRVDPFG